MTLRTVIDNENRPPIVEYFHGGAPGLTPGELILPAFVTHSTTAVGRLATGQLKRKYRDDRVFITPDFKFALFFAAMHPSGEGAVYRVDPIGELEIDPHWESIRSEGTSYRETKQCESALVLGIVNVPAGMFAEARSLVGPPTAENKWERIQREALERRRRGAR
jgi:hypothetical protein